MRAAPAADRRRLARGRARRAGAARRRGRHARASSRSCGAIVARRASASAPRSSRTLGTEAIGVEDTLHLSERSAGAARHRECAGPRGREPVLAASGVSRFELRSRHSVRPGVTGYGGSGGRPRRPEPGAAARRRGGARARLHPRRRRLRARRRRSRGGSRTRSRPARSRRTRSSPSRSPTRPRARCARASRRSASPGVRARTFHSAALAQLRHFAPERGRADPPVEGAAAAPDRERAARRRTSSGPRATSRPRSSGRRTAASTPRSATAREARRPRAADPGRPDAARLPRVRAAQGGARARSTSRTCSSSRSGCSRTTSTRASDVPRRATARSPSTSTRTSTCSSRRCSSSGSATRDDLCVVGDDYQSIYAFTGAAPEHLLAMPARFPHATVVRLEENYRSTPQVLELANRLVPRLGGAEKTLRATLPDGPEPVVRAVRRAPRDEVARVVERDPRAARRGRRARGDRVLAARTRAWPTSRRRCTRRGSRSRARRCSSATRRAGCSRRLERATASTAAGARARRGARGRAGSTILPEKLGERELVAPERPRAARAARRASFDDARARRRVRRRAAARASTRRRRARGVHLLTLPPREGPRVRRGLPAAARGEGAAVAAGAHRRPRSTRSGGCSTSASPARERHLALTWSGKPSRFLAELGVAAPPAAPGRARRVPDDPRFDALRAWRLERAKADEVPAVRRLPRRDARGDREPRPQRLGELAQIAGVGPAKLERYGDDVLSVARSAERREQQVEHAAAGRAGRARRLPRRAFRSSSARGSVSGTQPPLADQRLVDAAEPAAVGRVDGHAERRRLAVHRPAGGDDEVGERDQALRVDGADRGRSPTGARAARRSRAAPSVRGSTTACTSRRGPRCSSVCGKSGFECRW